MIVDVCPVCGAECIHIAFTSVPPKKQYRCTKCGWYMDETEEIQKVPVVSGSEWNSIPQYCRLCSNHPSNGGTGICHCILGSQTMC